MSGANTQGQIITFYSFKGGVGRTMALANVAFLAALNGKRVLVMDWDLEAPGLSYYFRGLLDGPDSKALKDAPGILDIVWNWSNALKEATTDEATRSLIGSFDDGTPFQNCVRPLVSGEHLPPGATLDIIGPGSPMIATPEMVSYEEALATFSWPTFLEKEAGGVVLDRLRHWAKSRYDIVLLDSRTGLADVAGICTIQIPDAVALCFVMNRQNIDGTAKVAAAIRAKRTDGIVLRAVPMRVASRDTSEEADARARAMTELSRIGGFSREELQEDFRVMSVQAADNVPFYETLAPFVAPDPESDVLTSNYRRMGKQFLGQGLAISSFDWAWVEQVRYRLQPRNATVDYLAKLKSAEPARTIAELARLLESACQSLKDGEDLEIEYVCALVESIFGIESGSVDVSEMRDMRYRAIDLLQTIVLTPSQGSQPAG
jgi:hypothetical protein